MIAWWDGRPPHRILAMLWRSKVRISSWLENQGEVLENQGRGFHSGLIPTSLRVSKLLNTLLRRQPAAQMDIHIAGHFAELRIYANSPP